jgi:hypothetical protein
VSPDANCDIRPACVAIAACASKIP